MIAWLITALGLVLVLEGLVYAIFPRQMKAMLKSIIEYSDNTLSMDRHINSIIWAIFNLVSENLK
jgi:uncharacterized protein YjeT (DUF2065 family)